jgi:hypothetical protein
MIEDIDFADYYPIDAEITDGGQLLVATAETYTANGTPYSLSLSGAPTRAAWKEINRGLRTWLRGSRVEINHRIYRAPRSSRLPNPLA